MDISASGSQDFELRLGLTTLASLVLRLSHLDYNYTTHFNRFLACKGQIMGLLSFHNLMNQSLVNNLFIYLPTYLLLVLLVWRILTVVVGGLLAKSYPTLVTLWTVACQAPLSMGFSRQEYWSGLPFSSPGDLPNPGIEPGSPA